MSKIGFLFPGQGAQQVGMCREAYEELPAVRELFEQAKDILGYDLSEICFNGPKEKLDSTDISQPALYLSGMAAIEMLKANSPEAIENCQAAAGLSLGEYTAIAFAGGLSFEDGLRLVQKRGEAMQAASDATPSGMVSVLGLDEEAVQNVCDQARIDGQILQIANRLCPGNIVVSGHKASCERVSEVAEKAGAMKSIPLDVAGAFHTPIMDSAVEKLVSALEQVEFKPTRIPVFSNVDAETHSTPDEFRELLVKQVCAPVLWHPLMDKMLADGFDEFYEVGTGRVLRSLLKRIARKTPMHGTLDGGQKSKIPPPKSITAQKEKLKDNEHNHS